MELRRLTWDDIKSIWDTKLWPGRDSEPVTSMKYLGGYDMAYKDEEPVFMGIVTGSHIVACNSYVHTSNGEYRSRGLWVDPNFRGQGHARSILRSMLVELGRTNATMVWTMPREEALPAYESAGFIRTSGWFEADWGRNCYAMYSLRTIKQITEDATYIKAGRVSFYIKHLMNLVEGEGTTTEVARRLMKPLADEEQENWG